MVDGEGEEAVVRLRLTVTNAGPVTGKEVVQVYVGDVASTDREEIVIRDLDLDEITKTRNDWQFYRDRRPDSYQRTTAP